MGKRGTRTGRKAAGGSGAPRKAAGKLAESYNHPTASALLRPDVGTQAQFKKKKPPATYRYDSSLSPDLNWDGQNPARELGEWLLRQIEEAAELTPERVGPDAEPFVFPKPREFRGPAPKNASADNPTPGPLLATVRGLADAVERLKALGRPFLNWASKAERLSFDVPTLPLFIHERLSTKAILETLRGHKRDKQLTMFDLFGDKEHPIHDQVLRAYEYPNGWVNRMVLGDSLVVMNSLLHYEGLGGQVQMIYMDPPYGVKFGSNFQPFVRKRDVKHNDDEAMTREPEMVRAYRDTWELGLHSYLTYLRDRLYLCHDLLAPSGSLFVQISDENVHHVRELMDGVFGAENAVVTITFKKKSATTPTDPVNDYLLWFAKDKTRLKVRQLFLKRAMPEDDPKFNTLISPSWQMKRVKELEEGEADSLVAAEWKWARVNYPLVSQDENERSKDFTFNGKPFKCGRNRHWTFDPDVGMNRLADAKRLFDGGGESLGGVVFWNDWPYVSLPNVWGDIHGDPDPIYVVQTSYKAVQRCILMTTDPGDLVLDPTCGSGTTAFVAEQWGRRWITIDTSRVPLALARQRLLTATFPYYELKDERIGPAGGFVYQRRQNSKGEEVGGIVPHVTLKSIANNEPPEEEVLVDRPEEDRKITRVTGPFCAEATIPTPVDWDADGVEDSGIGEVAESHGSFVERMLEVLRKCPVLNIGGGKSVTLRNVRPPAKTLSLSAEAMVDVMAPGQSPTIEDAVQEAAEKNGRALPLSGRPVAIVFGPENGAISEKLVYEAAREAHAKNYSHLYVIGFAIQPNARKLVDESEAAVGVPATYVQATPDLMMGDLLKNMRSSQIFSVCGLPEVRLRRADAQAVKKAGGDTSGTWYQVELLGLDVFDPATMEVDHRGGGDVPAWFLDTDYNGLCFHVSQAFFPRTAAWDDLKRSLRAEFEESVWEHLSGTVSAPFEAGRHGQVAVKVIDDRGNELMVVKNASEAEG